MIPLFSSLGWTYGGKHTSISSVIEALGGRRTKRMKRVWCGGGGGGLVRSRQTPATCRSGSAERACLSTASRWSWSASRPPPWGTPHTHTAADRGLTTPALMDVVAAVKMTLNWHKWGLFFFRNGDGWVSELSFQCGPRDEKYKIKWINQMNKSVKGKNSS